MTCVTWSWSCSAAVAALCACSSFGVGCATDEPPPKTAANLAPEPAPEAPQAAPEAVQTDVVASKAVMERCQIPDTPKQAPQFDFDQADLRPRGESFLGRIATCMQDGALKGQSLTLVGRADPRGPDSYNKNLGMERARAVRDYLASQGVAVSALQVKSRGELDASGTEPATWQLDRRMISMHIVYLKMLRHVR